MKKLIILSVATLLVACNSSKTTSESTSTTTTTTTTETETNSGTTTGGGLSTGIFEPINQTVPYKESVILLGKVNREGFKQEPFNSWFDKNFKEHVVDQETVKMLTPLLKGIKIKAFMGTWCSDSQRDIPPFYKILEAANYNFDDLDMVAMSREKNTPAQYEKDLDIVRVPTFIFYREYEEIGRYVEFARESLEKDMYAILSGANYKHSYED